MNIITVLEGLLEGFADFGEPPQDKIGTGDKRWFTLAGIGNEPTFDDAWNPNIVIVQFVAIRVKGPGGLKDDWAEFVRRMGHRLIAVLFIRAGERSFDGLGIDANALVAQVTVRL